MIEAIYDRIDHYIVKVVCRQSLHVGSADGDSEKILKDAVTGKPYVQAAGIAGVLGEYVERNSDAKIYKKMFGSTDAANGIEGKSRVVVLDGAFDPKTVSLERRTRCSINPETGSVNTKKGIGAEQKRGQVVSVESIGKGAEFTFVLLLYGKKADGETYREKLEETLAAVDRGEIRFGGFHTIGYGRVALLNVYRATYQMTKAEDRKAWADQTNLYAVNGAADVTDAIRKESAGTQDGIYRIQVQMRFDEPLLIKADTIDEGRMEKSLGKRDEDKRLPDTMNLINSLKEYIIPGSSLKGVFRGRMNTIADYMGIEAKDLDAVFENRSRISFEDAILTGEKALEQTRIRINKISGGVKNKALFSECLVGGKAELELYIKERKNKDTNSELSNKSCVALLLYVLRDLMIGAVTLGSGASIGRGRGIVERVIISDGKETKADFSMEQNVTDPFVKECLQELAH